MKLCFICGCLEPGRDGVGDYTRRLGGELVRQGHTCAAVALNDTGIFDPKTEWQTGEESTLRALRLPATMPWNQRIAEAHKWLKGFEADWFSLQFVPFGFHPRGLCFGLGHRLAEINSFASWHVMFHELWLGLGRGASLKERIWGGCQRHAARAVLQRLRPPLVHTQAEPYRTVLARERIETGLLPLFSNIPVAREDGWNDLLAPLIVEVTGKSCPREELYLAGILGSVHREWNVQAAVDLLQPPAQASKKNLALVFLGKNNLPIETCSRLRAELNERAEIVFAGEYPGNEISKILNALDLGLATSPRQIIQKSGSVAAMLEHGLPVLAIRDDWQLRWPAPAIKTPVLSPADFKQLKQLPTRNPNAISTNTVAQVARQMIADMNAHLSEARNVARDTGELRLQPASRAD